MEALTASLKTESGYKKVFGIVDGKFGQQAVLFAEGKQHLTEWLKNPDAKNLYLNIKVWKKDAAQSNVPERPISDEAPF